MSNRAWMPLYLDDYLADTGHLTTLEHGAYMLLIMHYWRHSGLPDDERMIARIARLSKEEWAESRDILASMFGAGWTHKRIDAELTKADEIIEKRRNAANRRHGNSTPAAHAEQVQSKSSDTGALPRTDNLSDGVNTPSSSPEPEKSAPVVVELPCTSGQTYPVSEADVAEWSEAFPAVDVRQQLSAMRQWLIANPTRRKTKRGARKFVVSWLDRRQNAGPAATPRGHSPPSKPNAFTAYDEIARERGWNDEPERIPGNNGDAERLSAERGGREGVVVDLRKSADGTFGSGGH